MYKLLDTIVRVLKRIIPEPVVIFFRPIYHRTISFLMAVTYGFPAKKLTVIGVTGTKGKSTVAEMLFAILSEEGNNTALASTIRFAIGKESKPNLFKMTLQGRGFIQSFMKKALSRKCTHMVVEITSESVLQARHWFLYLNGLVVTNIQPEHIERHGSFEKYVSAKRTIVRALEKSPKKNRVLVANEDIPETKKFLNAQVTRSIGFSENDLENVISTDTEVSFTYDHTPFVLPIPGKFNAMNALSAIKLADHIGVPREVTVSALKKLVRIPGRVERIEEGQDFIAVVDYAHTPDSLKALYEAFPNHRKICVLGNTGGGRDTWKRGAMGKIADEFCDEIILTNEDPYDEDPRSIVEAMASVMQKKPLIIMDRKDAIRAALRAARTKDAVLISGKGTDPYIMEENGKKTPWSDATVVRDILADIIKK
ncbi:UDP-N-acetylmuramoylalanyl-D-glutamate--2,6-diaminopimelate ligase [hydrothermal vent metagenome]|uniref:UDP-N-acetylmuramoylalanyl-D-glutamate--2,6-diaminopimelate ligase n=1 Tax=hydrothermal vent metagenome TaxID=652676 RepID=A0A3B0VLP3_9ZZZZ